MARKTKSIYQKMINFVVMNYKESLKDLILIKKYVIFVSVLFLLSILTGVFLEPTYGENWLNLLQQILDSIASLSGVSVVMFIIKNNLKIAILGIILGLFFGLFPLMATIVNGLIIGTVLRMTARESVFMLWRILPHGVFEIPALIIAFSLGIKLGLNLLTSNRLQNLNENGKRIFRLLIFVIIPMIILAGVIEGLLISFNV